MSLLLPARLRDAGNQALVRHFAETDSADAEAANDAAWAPADVASGVGANCKLRFALRLLDQCLFSQTSPPVLSGLDVYGRPCHRTSPPDPPLLQERREPLIAPLLKERDWVRSRAKNVQANRLHRAPSCGSRFRLRIAGRRRRHERACALYGAYLRFNSHPVLTPGAMPMKYTTDLRSIRIVNLEFGRI